MNHGKLTDAQLEGMSRWAEEPDLPAFAMYCGPLAAQELKERRALDETRRLEIEELVERRKADLSEDDRILVAIIQRCVENHPCIANAYWREGAVELLERLRDGR